MRNPVQYSVQTIHDLGIPEADHSIALLFKKAGALLVIIDSMGVVPTVNLYHEPVISGNEVTNERTDGKLAVESDTG